VGVFVKTMALYIYKKQLYNLYKKTNNNYGTKSYNIDFLKNKKEGSPRWCR
jgi:hypothetical protein